MSCSKMRSIDSRLAATAEDSQVSDMRSRELAVAQVDAHSASQLADMITRNSLDAIRIGKASREASRQIGFEPDEATTRGPRSKIAKVEGRAESVEQIRRVEALLGGAIVLRSCEVSLKFAAAGPRCWAAPAK